MEIDMDGQVFESKPRLRRNKGAGLTLTTTTAATTCPIDIPTRHSFTDSLSGSLDNSYEAFSPSRSIGTQTPTEHLSFEYPIPCVGQTTMISVDSPTSPIIHHPVGRRRNKPGLYGQHSFREEREVNSSWLSVPDWFRLRSSGARNNNLTFSAFSRGSRMRRSVVVTSPPRPTSTSFSSNASSVEDLEGIGQTLRSIGDDFDRLGFRP